MKPKLLIVDGDRETRTQMKRALVSDYDLILACDRVGAVGAFQAARPLVVLLDLGLQPRPADPEEGLAALAELTALESLTKVIVIIGQAERGTGLSAIAGGACDIVAKPVEMEELKTVLRHVFHVADLERELREKQREMRPDVFEGMLGASAAMRRLFDTIRKVATLDAPVLLLGESGTGKEMAAQAIHQCSGRKKGPFVAVDCSAIPQTLLGRELFGRQKGSLTGTHNQRKGRFESAIGGTLFLDKIGEIPLPLQVKLLRFLQERCIERVGGWQPIPIDARIITATNANLKNRIADGTFRENLFYRLAEVSVTLPPLRERQDDILLLTQYFLHRFAEQAGKPGLAFDQESIRALIRNSWPGNVRQLENCIHRAVLMADGKRVTVHDLELPDCFPNSGGNTLKQAREILEKEMVQNALRKHGGRIAPAAMELGISRPAAYDLMNKLGIAGSDLDARRRVLLSSATVFHRMAWHTRR